MRLGHRTSRHGQDGSLGTSNQLADDAHIGCCRLRRRFAGFHARLLKM
jgi:hypothetical protein